MSNTRRARQLIEDMIQKVSLDVAAWHEDLPQILEIAKKILMPNEQDPDNQVVREVIDDIIRRVVSSCEAVSFFSV